MSALSEAQQDELTNPVAVAKKLMEMINRTGIQIESTTLPDPIRTRNTLAVLLTQLRAYTSADRAERDAMYTGEPPLRSEFTLLQENWTFAELAYEEHLTLRLQLDELGYTLIRHEETTQPGRVGHFVAFSPEKKLAIISIKGTSSSDDVITDCLAASVQADLGLGFPAGEMYAHEGMLKAAQALLDATAPLVEHLFLPTGYRVLVCGHSLGAGTASIFGTLLRARIPVLSEPGALTVHAFACPPVLDSASALACAPFVTSVVNNTDVVPRASVANIEIMISLLQRYDSALLAAGFDVGNTLTLAQLVIRNSNVTPIIPANELFGMLADTQQHTKISDPSHLYVPGRCVITFERETENTGNKEIGTVTGDGTHPMLRAVEFDQKLLNDHLALAYTTNLKKALENLA